MHCDSPLGICHKLYPVSFPTADPSRTRQVTQVQSLCCHWLIMPSLRPLGLGQFAPQPMPSAAGPFAARDPLVGKEVGTAFCVALQMHQRRVPGVERAASRPQRHPPSTVLPPQQSVARRDTTVSPLLWRGYPSMPYSTAPLKLLVCQVPESSPGQFPTQSACVLPRPRHTLLFWSC